MKSDFGISSKKAFWFVWAWIKLLDLSVFQAQLGAEVLSLSLKKLIEELKVQDAR